MSSNPSGGFFVRVVRIFGILLVWLTAGGGQLQVVVGWALANHDLNSTATLTNFNLGILGRPYGVVGYHASFTQWIG
jgi:hypothetical protein